MSGLNGNLIYFSCQSFTVANEMSYLQDSLFLDRDGGGYFNNTGEDSSVLLRVKEDHDGAEPSGNSVSAINLIRLASMVSGSKADYYKRNAEHLLVCKPFLSFLLKNCFLFLHWLSCNSLDSLHTVLQAVFEKRLKDMAMAVPLMCCATDMLRLPSRKQVVVVGERTSEEFENMLAAAHTLYDPNRTVSKITLYKVDVPIFLSGCRQ